MRFVNKTKKVGISGGDEKTKKKKKKVELKKFPCGKNCHSLTHNSTPPVALHSTQSEIMSRIINCENFNDIKIMSIMSIEGVIKVKYNVIIF